MKDHETLQNIVLHEMIVQYKKSNLTVPIHILRETINIRLQ